MNKLSSDKQTIPSKRKILFLLRDLERGGIPRVMLNLVSHIDPAKYSVDIFCGNPVGIFRDRIPANSRLLKTNFFLRAIMCNLAKEGLLFKTFAIFVKTMRKAGQRLFHYDILNCINESVIKSLKTRKYDVIWACSEGLPSIWSRAAEGHCRKVIWIHNDYSWDCACGDKVETTDFSIFDSIVCVSEFTRKNFCKVYPEYESKTKVLYNLLNEKEILKMAEEYKNIQWDPACFNILSIGRFSYQKNFEIIPQIAAELIAKGQKNFKWYIVGNGGIQETLLIQKSIKKHKVEEYVLLLGEQPNPYKFLKTASLFALTSRYESYPTVINEAKFLGCPVISTDFNGVEEILDRKYGSSLPIEQFPAMIKSLIEEKAENGREEWRQDTSAIIEEFYKIISEGA